MEVGLTVYEAPTLEETLAQFERSEERGIDALWFPHFFGFDALSVIALAAARTCRVRLGTSVVPMYPRHPVLTAQSAQVAQEVAGGRLLLGVGTGHRTHISEDLGITYDRPIGYAREYVMILRQLLRGEPVDHDGRMLSVHVQLQRGAWDTPVVLAAVGPQMLALAGEVADGAITWLCDRAYLDTVAIPALNRGAQRGDRPTPPLYAGLPICIHDNVAEARDVVNTLLAHHSGLEAYRNALDRVEEGRSPGDVALVGTEEAVTRELEELAALGVAEIGLSPMPAGQDIAASFERTLSFISHFSQGNAAQA
jgi:5,10-methylenetetrahydromethanopterin reductase